MRVQFFWVLQQNPATAFEYVLSHRVLQLTVELAPNLHELVVHQLHHVEMIEDLRDAGQVFKHGADIRLRSYPLPPPVSWLASVSGAPRTASVSPPLCRRRQRQPCRSQDHHHVALADTDFVNGDVFKASQLRTAETPMQMAFRSAGPSLSCFQFTNLRLSLS